MRISVAGRLLADVGRAHDGCADGAVYNANQT